MQVSQSSEVKYSIWYKLTFFSTFRTKESIGRQEKLKEEQRHRMKVWSSDIFTVVALKLGTGESSPHHPLQQILNLRLREAEQQRLREAELERQRQVEGRERLRNLNTIQEEILQLNQLLDPSSQTKSDVPLASLTSLSTRGNQLCSQVSEVVRKTAEVSITANLWNSVLD